MSLSTSRLLKRAIDVAAAATGLGLTAPLLIATGIAIRAQMGRPVLFTQERPGLKGLPFKIYKFRTMTDARDANGKLLPDDQRLTDVGRFVRSTSIDELPQLLNVLKGEMSIVGPRPLLMQYLKRYSPEQARRHDVKPGITGWAQGNGRNALSWEEKFQLDTWYVDNWSLLLDAKILVRTALKVVMRDGISNQGSQTMPEFTGSGGISVDDGPASGMSA